MTEEKQTTENKPAEEKSEEVKAPKVEAKPTNAPTQGGHAGATKSVFGVKKRGSKKFSKRPEKKKDDFEQRILDLARVTRVMKGGKRMRFRACVVIGDKKGKVGIGMGKGADVAIAMNKAANVARKNIVEVSTVNETIPHEVFHKFGAGKILLKPASRGKGVIAGGIVRVILELAGIHNVTSKILGTNNKVTNAKCTIEALKSLKRVEAKDKTKKEAPKKTVKEEKIEKK